MRKLASQIPEAVSRLQRAGIESASPPTWYQPVLSHPPPVQPARSSVKRTARVPGPKGSTHTEEIPLYNDLFPKKLKWDAQAEGTTKTHKAKHFRSHANRERPLDIVYEEDRVRRQFFRDFPYEALRPTSLVEGTGTGTGTGTEVGGVVDGKEWTMLVQRGKYPTVEDTIAYTLNQHHNHNQTISDAYYSATYQFTNLRAHHELATIAAETEARAYGAEFKRSAFERLHAKEEEALSTLSHLSSPSPSSSSSLSSSTPQSASSSPTSTETSPERTSNKFRKPTRWSSSVPGMSSVEPEFSSGATYVKGWKLPPPLAYRPDGAVHSQVQAQEEEGAGEAVADQGISAQSQSQEERASDLDLLNAFRTAVRA